MRRENYSRGYGDRSNNYGYGSSQGRSRYNDEHIYQRDYEDYDDYRNNRQNSGYGSNSYAEYDGRYDGENREFRGNRNFLERAGDRIRDKWNDWTDNDSGSYRNDYREYRNYDRNGRNSWNDDRDDDRNIFQRAGDKIRETWNEWTDNDDRDDRYDRGRNSYNYGRNSFYGDHDRGNNRGNYSSRSHSRNYEDYGRQERDSSSRNYGNGGRSSNNNYGGSGRSSANTGGRQDQENYGRGNRSSFSNDYRYHNADTGSGRHDYSYGRSGSSRWDSDDHNSRYYNGQGSGSINSRNRSRLQEPQYSY